MKGAGGDFVRGWEMEGKTGKQHGFRLKKQTHTRAHAHTHNCFIIYRVCEPK